MQEELRQKKNALEALMRRMGKSSSLNVDNISDNISEGSERLREEEEEEDEGEEVVRGMGATWGASGHHNYSDDQFRQSRWGHMIMMFVVDRLEGAIIPLSLFEIWLTNLFIYKFYLIGR